MSTTALPSQRVMEAKRQQLLQRPPACIQRAVHRQRRMAWRLAHRSNRRTEKVLEGREARCSSANAGQDAQTTELASGARESEVHAASSRQTECCAPATHGWRGDSPTGATARTLGGGLEPESNAQRMGQARARADRAQAERPLSVCGARPRPSARRPDNRSYNTLRYTKRPRACRSSSK